MSKCRDNLTRKRRAHGRMVEYRKKYGLHTIKHMRKLVQEQRKFNQLVSE